MILLSVKLDLGRIDVALEHNKVNVQTQPVGEEPQSTSAITVQKDEWVYIGVSWRNTDGRVALMVEDEMDSVYGVFVAQSVQVSDNLK